MPASPKLGGNIWRRLAQSAIMRNQEALEYLEKAVRERDPALRNNYLVMAAMKLGTQKDALSELRDARWREE